MRHSLFWDVTQHVLLVSYCLPMEDGTVSLSRNVGGYRYTLRNIPEERISQNKSFYFLVTEKVQYVGCGNPHDHIVIPYTPVTSCIFCLHAFSCKILFKWAWNWKERTHIHSHVSKWGIQSRLIFQKICSQICWKLQVPGTYPCLVFTDRLCVRPSARVNPHRPFPFQIANVLKRLSMPDDWK